MYKVLKDGEGWSVYWIESPDTEPMLVPRLTDDPQKKWEPYPIRQAAYRRCKKLNDAVKDIDKRIKRDGAIIL
jgi:hypothetical protein